MTIYQYAGYGAAVGAATGLIMGLPFAGIQSVLHGGGAFFSSKFNKDSPSQAFGNSLKKGVPAFMVTQLGAMAIGAFLGGAAGTVLKVAAIGISHIKIG